MVAKLLGEDKGVSKSTYKNVSNFQKLEPDVGVTMICAPCTVTSYCNPFQWARSFQHSRTQRKLVAHRREQDAQLKKFVARRHTSLEKLKVHNIKNEHALKRAEHYVQLGMHEEAEQQWGKLRPLKSPRNRLHEEHIDMRLQMLAHLPSTISEQRESKENPTPFGTPEKDSFLLAAHSIIDQPSHQVVKG